MKTTQTLPNGSKIIVYTNYAGMPMLKVTIDPGGTNKWIEFYRYKHDGLLIWIALPSAVTGYDDTYDDLEERVTTFKYDPDGSLVQAVTYLGGNLIHYDYWAVSKNAARSTQAAKRKRKTKAG